MTAFVGCLSLVFGSSDHRNAVEAPPLADKQVELRCEPYLIDILLILFYIRRKENEEEIV